MKQSLKALRDAFLRWAECNRSRPTVENYQRYIDRFCVAMAGVAPDRLRPHHLLTWGKTWHEVQAVQRWFNWLKNDAELIDKNPFARVKRPLPGARRRVLDRVTLARFLRAADPPFRRYLLALRETLARPQEIRGLTWCDLYWPEKPLRPATWLTSGQALCVLEEFKARARRRDAHAPRVIPISARLGRLLARIARGRLHFEGPIFLNSRGDAWTGNAVRCRMRRLRCRVGVAPDERGENIVAYTIRHTMATRATARKVRDRLLADLLGHTSTKTTARYQHLQRDDLIEAMRTVHARQSVG